jgi:hypothetical protein
MRRPLPILTVLVALAALSGCADFRARPSQGLEWHQANEAQKRELTRQGFDQYSPSM